MEKIYFYGPGKMGESAYNKWMKYENNEYELVGYLSELGQGIKNNLPIFQINEIEPSSTIVITLARYEDVKKVYLQLRALGFTKIYKFLNLSSSQMGNSFLEFECFETEFFEEGNLEYAEMHVVDFCNLNCKGCSHFSPLFEKDYPDLNLRLEDVKTLKSKISSLYTFRIMGGEPFLHPDLSEFLDKIRSILPKTDLRIVTNGLLIPSLSDEILQCISKNNITVDVSEYVPTHKLLVQIVQVLEKWNIRYWIASMGDKQVFNKPLSVSENSELKRICMSPHCVNIWNGKISRCPTLMYVEKFNDTFGTNLSQQGVYELKSCPSGEELINLLKQRVTLCNHCVENLIPWERCGKEITIEDFATQK